MKLFSFIDFSLKIQAELNKNTTCGKNTVVSERAANCHLIEMCVQEVFPHLSSSSILFFQLSLSSSFLCAVCYSEVY